MNFLIVMPKSFSKAECLNIFPLGLAYISASLKKEGYNVFTANLDFHEGNTHSILKNLICSNNIDVICTGGLSRDYPKIKEVFETALRIKPEILLIAGGGIISSDPEPSMRVLGADIGVIGEGEITICELAHALNSKLSYDNIPGLIYKVGDSLKTTPPRKEMAELDSIPFPDFDGFNYSEWTKSSGCGVLVSERSCPFHCTFCFHPSGEKYRQRSLDSILQEVEYQIERYGVKCIGMTGELFATKMERIVEFCNRVKKYNITWSCGFRVSDVKPDLLRMMKDSGCVLVCLGLESADNSVLKSMRKGITVEQIETALKITYDVNMLIQSNLIFGDINETCETVENTLRFWRTHNDMHYINLDMISVYPGSFLYKHACETGIIKNREQFLMDGCPLINVSKLSGTEYKELLSRITELRLHPHVPAKSFQIKKIQPNGECDIVLTCRKCKAQNEATVNFWRGKEITCPSCNMITFIDPFQRAFHLEDAFFAQLPSDRKVALWGAGGIYYKLMQKYKALSSDRFILVDSNKSHQGLSICQKEIHHPEIILKDNIGCVIITALSRKDDILNSIHNEFPSVKTVLTPDFDITKEGVIPVLKVCEMNTPPKN